MRHLGWILALGLGVAAGAHAEIEKTAAPGCDDSTVCTYVWPKVAPPPGWRQDKDISQRLNLNLMVPEDAKGLSVYLYAGVMPGEDRPATVAGFIAEDKETLLADYPGLQSTDLPPLTTADGQVLPVVQFDPTQGHGRFDVVAYGEETDGEGNRYYLTFVISGKTQALRDGNLAVLKALVAGYRK